MDRSLETIQADWRAAIDQREGMIFDPDLEARIEVLRIERTAAIETRQFEIQETRTRRSRAC